MNGMEVVQHGVSMLLRNLGPAVRISIGPLVIGAAVVVLLALLGLGSIATLLGPAGGSADPAAMEALGAGAAVGALIAGVVWLFVLSWIAVAWHRYVLLEEKSGLLPPLRQALVWPYLGRTILLALLLALVAIPAGMVLAFVFGVSGGSIGATLLGGLLLWLLLGWIAMRLSLVLPARAVDRPMSFGESWAATAPASGGIFVVVLVLGVINVVLSWVFGALFGGNLLGAILSLILQWFTAMLGLSVLTTLYGHLVERRTLAA